MSSSEQKFVVIDFETANPRFASICQIGLVHFIDGIVDDVWQTLVDPEDYFDLLHVLKHGIDEEAVRGAPTFPGIYGELSRRIEGAVTISHTAFDRVALTQAVDRYQLTPVACTWLDTARVVRRAWPQFARKGYALSNITTELDIDYQAHYAPEDARAAGEVLLRAMEHTGLDLNGWLKKVEEPITPPLSKIKLEANPDGPLFGEVVVFTGALSMPRREAAARAAQAGCEVVPSVKKATTLLVVGDQDLDRLAGHTKSSKHRRAEQLISTGKDLRIIGESDFLKLIEH